MKADANCVVTWAHILTVPIAAVVALIIFLPPELLRDFVAKHFAAVVGLPHAARPLKFEGRSFKFKGDAGEVMHWVFSFLAIPAAIRWRYE